MRVFGMTAARRARGMIAFGVLLAAALVLLAVVLPGRAAAASSGTWHGVSYDIDDAGVVTFHAGTMTGNFRSDDPFKDREGLKDATSVKADGTVVLPADSSYMFDECDKLESINMANFDSSQVTNMSWMFACGRQSYEEYKDYRYHSALTSLDVSGFGTSSVTNMSYMFYGCSSLASLDVSGFGTSQVTNMSYMFDGCSSLASLDVSGFGTSNVTDMGGMFSGCSSLASLDVSGFGTSNVTSMSCMFSYCSSLASLDVSGFGTSNVTSMYGMFSGCSSLASLDVSGFGTSNVTSMSCMFYGCSSLASLDVSGFGTSSVTNMSYMFSGCSSLASLDVSGFDTSQVQHMYSMFYGCSSLASLDVSGFGTSNVTGMSSMFSGCSSLASLDVSGFGTSNVTSMGGMFYGCSSLASLDVSGFGTSRVTNMSYMFDGCSSLASLDVSGFDTSQVTYMSHMFSGCSSLAAVTLGDKFSFCGSGTERLCSLPNGTWLSSADGVKYAASAVPNNVAATYTLWEPVDLGTAVISAVPDQPYTGSAVEPKPAVALGGKTLAEGTDYQLSYSGNVNAGTATVKVLGLGDYTGTASATFRILPADLGAAAISAVPDQAYTGSAVEPKPAVALGGKTLAGGTDYQLSYSGNVNAGTATVKVLGLGDYTGTASATFRILPADLGAAAISAVPDQAYTGSAVEPKPTVALGGKTLAGGTDYQLSWSDNVGPGIATVTVTGRGNYTGTASAQFKISRFWHGVAYDVGASGAVTFHAGTLTGGFASADPFWSHDGLKDATSVTADGEVVLPADSNGLFSDCSKLESIDLSRFDSSQVTDVSRMFSGCSSLKTLDLSGLDTSKATSMSDMFAGCDALKRVTLGAKFSFSGAGKKRLCGLPVGTWKSSADGKKYAGYSVPNKVAATYARQLDKTLAALAEKGGTATIKDKKGGVTLTVETVGAPDLTKGEIRVAVARPKAKAKPKAEAKVKAKVKAKAKAKADTQAVSGTKMLALAVKKKAAAQKKQGYVFKKKTYRVPVRVRRGLYTLHFVQVANGAFRQARGARKIVLHRDIEKIGRFAFKGSSFRIVVLQTKRLVKKKRVRQCLSGSKVGTVRVSVGFKKKSKKYVKKYRKIFKKKVVGRKVKLGR